MELTPQALRDVEFREKMRGYHPDDVDEFVERAFATADALAERLRQTEDRLRQAEQKATTSSSSDSDDSLRRTLVLAQRTADAAIAEAQEQAAATLSDAEQRSRSMIETADEQARRTALEAQEQLRRDVEQLSIARAELQSDVDSLRRYLEDERNSHREALSSALRVFEEGSLLNVPPLNEINIPPAPGDLQQGNYAPSESVKRDNDFLSSSPPAGTSEAKPNDDSDGEDSLVDLDKTMAVDADDDPYFAELRRAVSENEPLGPRDDDMPTGTHHTDDLFGDDRRFLRRRR